MDHAKAEGVAADEDKLSHLIAHLIEISKNDYFPAHKLFFKLPIPIPGIG